MILQVFFNLGDSVILNLEVFLFNLQVSIFYRKYYFRWSSALCVCSKKVAPGMQDLQLFPQHTVTQVRLSTGPKAI